MDFVISLMTYLIARIFMMRKNCPIRFPRALFVCFCVATSSFRESLNFLTSEDALFALLPTSLTASPVACMDCLAFCALSAACCMLCVCTCDAFALCWVMPIISSIAVAARSAAFAVATMFWPTLYIIPANVPELSADA